MRDKPELNFKRFDIRQHTIDKWLGIANILWHDTDTNTLFDELPMNQVIFRYDRKVAIGKAKSPFVEPINEFLLPIKSNEVSIAEPTRRNRVADLF